MRSVLTLFFLMIVSVKGYADSGIGPNGIDAIGLELPNKTSLTGAGIGIGQVDGSRPGKPVADSGPDDTLNSASTIVPAQVYMRTSVATSNGFRVDNHAEESASVMISTNNMAPGVAPGALLYASGYATTSTNQQDAALTANHVAERNGDDVSAINMSFGMALDGSATTDGNSHLSSFVDWSADRHDVLYVVAGREDIGGAGPVPSDNFNGITVAGSSNLGGSVFNNVWAGNVYDEDAEGDRVSIDLLAPATLIDVVQLGGAVAEVGVGTSIAAPHVTGTVGLLQQYAKFQIDNSVLGWEYPNARRHEIMKAVLMNSADKLEDTGDGNRLGMTRTVLKQDGSNWLTSPAASNEAIPVDEEFGAGHLNARRALKQFRPGEMDPDGADVGVIGWDYHSTTGTGDEKRYEIGPALRASSYISITLTWDRIVEFDIDQGNDNIYQIGDTFETYPTGKLEEVMNDLDIYLVQRGQEYYEALPGAGSVGEVAFGGYNLEHVFYEIPTTGLYDIIVEHMNTGLAFPLGPEDYAIAWWGATNAVSGSGDFNGDGAVDGEDLAQWIFDFGQNPHSDADSDGDSDGADFLKWQLGYGTSANVLSASHVVPEPATWIVLMIGGISMISRRKERFIQKVLLY